MNRDKFTKNAEEFDSLVIEMFAENDALNLNNERLRKENDGLRHNITQANRIINYVKKSKCDQDTFDLIENVKEFLEP